MDLDDFKIYNDTLGHPAGDLLLQRVAGARPAPSARATGRTGTAATSSRSSSLAPTGRESIAIADRIRAAVGALFERGTRPQVGASVGIACYPADGRTKDDIVAAADRSMYLVKPSGRGAAPGADSARDAYLSALNETALALMDHLDPTELLQTIMVRAASLIGVEHGFIYVVDPDGSKLTVRGGLGLFNGYLGYSVGRGEGASGTVWETGRPITIDDYDAFTGRRPDLPDEPVRRGRRRAPDRRGSGGRRHRPRLGRRGGQIFGGHEVAALERFAQLASIALANARLFDAAQRDLDQRRSAEERLARQALYDMVTGLPNRVLLIDRVRHALASGRVGEAAPIAMLILDLDRFKVINESLGHSTGDVLLGAVADRLQGSLRPGDTVARFMGDEFGILLDQVTGPEEAVVVAERIEALLAAPFRLGGRDVFVSASIGIAVGRARRDGRGGPPARRGDRVELGQGPLDRPAGHVRPVDERGHGGPARHRERPPPGGRARRVARPLPARRRPRDGPDHRLRGARPVAASRARPDRRRCRSSPSPRRPGSSCRSGTGSSRRPAGRPARGTSPGRPRRP